MKWILKTSTLRVSTRQRDRVYRSIDDVPPELQAEIRSTLNGPNTETIFLANQEAYSRIASIARDLSPESSRLDETKSSGTAGSGKRNPRWSLAFGIAVSALSAASLVWFVLSQIDTP